MSMDVSLAHPIAYVSVTNLWADTTLLVLGVVPPPSGQPSPSHDVLAELTVDTPQPIVISLPNSNGHFRHVAIAYAITTGPSDVGTATVSISRDEDPTDAGGNRPVVKIVDLTRSSTSSPLFIIRTFALLGT
jgi:hypothetical protein